MSAAPGARPGPGVGTIEIEGLAKRYRRDSSASTLLTAFLPRRRERKEHWALRDFDLTLGGGETVGILGHNGAGKTTLLRLLAGVTQPSEGRLRVAGRIAPLISVGVGFHQEMSGRENVFINGMLLGLTKRQVHEVYDSVVEFSELEDVLDTPVKFYSSGMMMRLGFSVAMHVSPEVLLVDEVLAVGDFAFQRKCFDRMRELQEGGTTIVLVSHSVHVVRILCPRAIVVDHGRKVFDGDSESAVAVYHELLSKPLQAHGAATATDQHVAEPVTLLERRLVDHLGNPPTELRHGDHYRLEYRVRFNEPTESPQVRFTVTSETGLPAYQSISAVNERYGSFAVGDEAQVVVDFVANMAGGSYTLTLEVLSLDARQVLAHDAAGLLAYRAPALGSSGLVELTATTLVDGVRISDHEPLTFGEAG